ncbi:tetratricopeptide repeat protein [Herpetosiphon geysericola]|uniref:ORC1/DEAH AAA+ ATPase domain-containing protein n=1 Tax=Herpetosiphon geysericola TaxID=70996 RepID=A0A0N8GTB9_9CHLR|nr:tetratricopeptide repeat protein [Herpetosiphon geysericola]KPL91666.1 hypothetical protein SE18_01360 [Herpetosiphon geysericola]
MTQHLWQVEWLQQLLQQPHTALNQTAIQQLVSAKGGLNSFLQALCQQALQPDQQRLLHLIVAEPQRSIAYYADSLGIHSTTYHRHFKKLCQQLTTRLNDGIAESQPNASFSLPIPPTSCLGRNNEQQTVNQLLTKGQRLISILGFGGVGKTRLALAIAEAQQANYRDGVCFCGLASISQPHLVLATIAEALGVAIGPQQTAEKALQQFLAHRHLLLILDNVEHVVEGVTAIGQLLREAPQLQIVATSRVPLNLYGEYMLQLQPLAVPSKPIASEDLAETPAIALFLERAQSHAAALQPDAATLEAIRQICSQLEGLPLALELAAAHTRVLSPQRLAQQLTNHVLGLKTSIRDLPERQRSLRNLISWSLDLLEPSQQQALYALAIWPAGWTISSASFALNLEETDPALYEILGNLVDHHLIMQVPQTERWVLHPFVRDYVLEQLASAQQQQLAQQHLAWASQLSEAFNQHFASDQQHWLDLFEAEHDNLRAALAWASSNHYPIAALNIAVNSWRFWWARNYFHEGQQWLDQALAQATSQAQPLEPTLHSRALNACGAMAWSRGDIAAAQASFSQSLALYDANNNPIGAAMARNNLALVAIKQQAYSQAEALFELNAAVFGPNPDQAANYAATLSNLSMLARYRGDLQRAYDLAQQTLSLRQQLNNQWASATSLTNLGAISLQRGEYQQAQAYYQQSLQALQQLGERESIAECLEGMAILAIQAGNYQLGAQRLIMVEQLRESIGAPRSEPEQALLAPWLAQLEQQLDAPVYQQIKQQTSLEMLKPIIEQALGEGSGARD